MTLSDHEELVNLLLHVKGKAMLSGYEHSVYKPLEQAGGLNWCLKRGVTLLEKLREQNTYKTKKMRKSLNAQSVYG